MGPFSGSWQHTDTHRGVPTASIVTTDLQTLARRIADQRSRIHGTFRAGRAFS